jgi:hypothetical protein
MNLLRESAQHAEEYSIQQTIFFPEREDVLNLAIVRRIQDGVAKRRKLAGPSRPRLFDRILWMRLHVQGSVMRSFLKLALQG